MFEGSLYSADRDPPELSDPYLKQRATQLGTLLLCKQIFNEAIELWYKHTTFVSTDSAPAIEYLSSIPARYRDKIARFDVYPCEMSWRELKLWCAAHSSYSLHERGLGFAEARTRLEAIREGRHEQGIELRNGVMQAHYKGTLSGERWLTATL